MLRVAYEHITHRAQSSKGAKVRHGERGVCLHVVDDASCTDKKERGL